MTAKDLITQKTGNMTAKDPIKQKLATSLQRKRGVPKIPSRQHSTGNIVYLKTSNQQHRTLDGGRLENEKLTFRSYITVVMTGSI